MTQTRKTFHDGRSVVSLGPVIIIRLTITIQRQIETGDEEVDNCQRPRASDSVVREDISQNREFRMQGNRGPGEGSDQGGERSLSEELLEWVEEQLADCQTQSIWSNSRAAESIFLPSIQLVVARERDTLFEFSTTV